MYIRIRCSALGDDFPRERFVSTPIAVIRRVLREIDDQEKGLANLNALPVARLTQLVIQIAHGFSGSKRPAPKLEVKEFLPYPDWRPNTQAVHGPSEGTRFVLTELGGKRKLPIHVFTALVTVIEQRP